MLVHEFSLRGAYAPLVSRWCLRRTPSRLGSARRGDLARMSSRDRELFRPFTAHLRQATAWRADVTEAAEKSKIHDGPAPPCSSCLPGRSHSAKAGSLW